ncbi:MAG: DUF1648 domain-containing protein [Candidatus Zixiibacteriota bacterium]|nr:MAG: DUF1648 domain-containing protein [candidate division Zixibacteria bacterium]
MSNYKPRIRVESTHVKRLLELVSIAGIIYNAFVLLRNWESIPDTVPSHFGLDGRPDAYAGKSSLLLLPIVGFAIYLALTILDRYPHLFSYIWKITPENAYRQYQLAGTMLSALKAEVIWIFNYIVLTAIKISTGNSERLSPLFLPILLVVIFGPICLYLYVSYKEK